MFWLSDVFTGTDAAMQMRRYETLARAARTRVTHRMLLATGAFVKRIGTVVGLEILSRLRAQRDRRELRHALNRMDTHQLADIGLTRHDVALVNRGHWPTRYTDDIGERAARVTTVATQADSDEHRAHRHEVDQRRAA